MMSQTNKPEQLKGIFEHVSVGGHCMVVGDADELHEDGFMCTEMLGQNFHSLWAEHTNYAC
jgi:hypothetical protein